VPAGISISMSVEAFSVSAKATGTDPSKLSNSEDGGAPGRVASSPAAADAAAFARARHTGQPEAFSGMALPHFSHFIANPSIYRLHWVSTERNKRILYKIPKWQEMSVSTHGR
jgi:hypothetical protein